MTLAQQLHEWYLEATKNLRPDSYNPAAQIPYQDLTEEQKSIDKYIAEKTLNQIQEKLAEMKKRSDSSTYLYEQGQSRAIEDISKWIETLK